jgi:hypothetical protein
MQALLGFEAEVLHQCIHTNPLVANVDENIIAALHRTARQTIEGTNCTCISH